VLAAEWDRWHAGWPIPAREEGTLFGQEVRYMVDNSSFLTALSRFSKIGGWLQSRRKSLVGARRYEKSPAPACSPLQISSRPVMRGRAGEMAEWLKAHAWKACVRETVPWVRIPLSPPPTLGSQGRPSPKSPISSIKTVFLRTGAVRENSRFRRFEAGDAVFLQSLVLRRISTVSKGSHLRCLNLPSR
jgi:hypothetical protein